MVNVGDTKRHYQLLLYDSYAFYSSPLKKAWHGKKERRTDSDSKVRGKTETVPCHPVLLWADWPGCSAGAVSITVCWSVWSIPSTEDFMLIHSWQNVPMCFRYYILLQGNQETCIVSSLAWICHAQRPALLSALSSLSCLKKEWGGWTQFESALWASSIHPSSSSSIYFVFSCVLRNQII